MEKVQGFFEKNWMWLLTLIFTLGVNYATLNAKIETKVSKEEVRQIVEEELEGRSYTLVDGKVMEVRITNMEKTLVRMETILQNFKEVKK